MKLKYLLPAGILFAGAYFVISGQQTVNGITGQSVTGVTATPGGSSGNLQYNNSGAIGGFALAGDCTLSQPNITCTKINGNTVTLGGAFTTSGAFATTLTVTAGTNVTLPTSGTLSVLAKNTYTGTQTMAVNTVASGATPAFDLSLGNVQYTSALAVNAAPTVTNITPGGFWNWVVCQNGTGGFTWTWPASVHGGMTIGTTASKCNSQQFFSPDGTNLYATTVGVINQ